MTGTPSTGAEFFEVGGWERPQWFDVERRPRRALRRRRRGRTNGTPAGGRRSSTPSTSRCASAAGIFDLSSFMIFDVVGPGALAGVQSVAMRQMDVPVGRVVYTPVLSQEGGFKSDLTIMRLGEDVFRVVTGGAHGMSDLKWFRDHLPADGAIADLTTAYTTIGLWGPRARDIAASITRADLSNEALPLRRPAARWRSGRSSSSPRGSRTSATSAGSCTCRWSRASGCGTSSGSRAAARPDRLRPGRLRHDRPAREELPRLRHGAGRRLQRGRGRHGPGQGQGPGLRRPRGASSASSKRRPRRRCAR